MTVDTTTLRAQWEAIREQQGPAAFAMIAHVGDGIALLDALDEERARNEQQDSLILWQGKALEAERERVRVLTEALQCLELGVCTAATIITKAALATAGGEGAAT